MQQINGSNEGHHPRPSTSRGTQRLYIRLNTLHYLVFYIHSLEKTLPLSPKIVPVLLNLWSVPFQQNKFISKKFHGSVIFVWSSNIFQHKGLTNQHLVRSEDWSLHWTLQQVVFLGLEFWIFLLIAATWSAKLILNWGSYTPILDEIWSAGIILFLWFNILISLLLLIFRKYRNGFVYTSTWICLYK